MEIKPDSQRVNSILEKKQFALERSSSLPVSHNGLENSSEQDVSALESPRHAASMAGDRNLPQSSVEDVNALSQRRLDLGPLLRIMKRQALLITGIAGVVTGVAWHFSATDRPVYEGTFRLLVEPVTSDAKLLDPSALTHNDRSLPNRDSPALDYPTQVEILQSPEMMSAIAKRVQVQYPSFNIRDLKDKLTVKRLGENELNMTKIVEVSYRNQSPELVDFVLKKTAQRYLKYSLEDRKSRVGEGVKFIENQLPRLQAQVTNLQAQLQWLQQQYHLVDPEKQSEGLSQQVRQIDNEQLAAQRELGEQKQLYANLQKQIELTPDKAMAASALSQDPSYQALRGKLVEVETQLASESARFLPGSPNIQTLEDKRQRLQTLLSQRSQQEFGSGVTASPAPGFQDSVRVGLTQQLVNAANQVQMLEVRNQKIAQDKVDVARQAQQFPAVARKYKDLQRQLTIATQTLDQMLTQRETLRVESAQSQVPWELVAQPQLRRDNTGKLAPVPSNSQKQLIVGAIGGLVLGIAAAVALEKYRDIFYSTKDLEAAIELPLLGVIPCYQRTEKSPNSLATFFGSVAKIEGSSQSAAQFLEAFDSLYANIRFIYADPLIGSLAVCSPAAGDGKSTIALHLAQVAAAMGQRVLLVDANLREPQLHNWLNLPNRKGLSDILAHQIAPEKIIEQSLLVDNLWVLSSGEPRPDSSRKLGSAQMQRLMQKLHATYDLVIYDTPSFDSPDANYLAAHTDGVLMVVGVGTTNSSKAKQALDRLKSFRLTVLGLVANHVTPDKDERVEGKTQHLRIVESPRQEAVTEF